MSQLLVPSHTVVDSISIARRIVEIMKEKGPFYSIVAMASRLGIGRETYRMMLKGDREIYSFELEKISNDLKTTSQRLLQEDICEDSLLLKELLDQHKNPSQAVMLAQKLNHMAVGLTERCHALLRLGLAYFFNQNYDESYFAITESQKLALQIKDLYNEDHLLFEVMIVLTEVYTAKQDYLNASKIHNQIEPIYINNPTRIAALKYLHAKVHESIGDYEKCKAIAYESIVQANRSEKKTLIGKTKVNAAHYEYLTGNFEASYNLLVEAIEDLVEDTKSQLIARKELVKTILKLGASSRASKEIEDAMHISRTIDHSKIEGKLLVLKSRAFDDPQYAESVAHHETLDRDIRLLACKFLMQFYRNKDDSTKFMHYYNIGEKLEPRSVDILDEGEL